MKKALLFLAAALTFGMAANAQSSFSEDFNNVADGAVPAGWTTYGDNLTNHYTDATLNDSWSALSQMMVCITWRKAGLIEHLSDEAVFYVRSFECLRHLIYIVYYLNAILLQYLGKSVMLLLCYLQIWYVIKQKPCKIVRNKSVNLSAYAGQNVYLAFACYTNDGMYIFLDNVEVKAVPANSISAVSASAPTWTSQNSNANVALTVRNEGSADLTSFDVTYTVNNGDAQVINVTGINVASFTNYTYTFPVMVSSLGATVINITVSNPNNDTDIDASDNSTSCETTVYDPNSTTQRNTLLEHFTTARCQYCPGGHDRLEQAMANFENRICWVAHHVGFYTDNMTINESEEIMALYGNNGTWAPAMTLDRNVDFADGAEAGGVVGSVGNVNDLVSQFNNATNAPAFVTIELSNLTYDPQTRQLNVTVSGSFVNDFVGTEPRLSLYLTQDGIYGSQQNTNGTIAKYEHNHVIRACISDVWGDADAFTSTTAGSNYSKTYTYTLPTKFSANNCRLVAFVNDYGPDMLHRTVANATKSNYLMTGNDPTTGIGDVQASMNVVTYPNPATEMVYVSTESAISSFEMVDALGRKVMGNENLNADILELNVSDLNAGIYFITITTERGTATQRVSVTK